MNDPRTNGEYWLLGEVMAAASGCPVLLDIGANKGAWSIRAIEEASKYRKVPQLHAFEPSAATRQVLEENLSSFPKVMVHALALSAEEGRAEFFSNGVGSGTNSLSPVSGSQAEWVQVSTVDAFLSAQRIEQIDMIKIDTEGFDLSVLQGATKTLTEGRVSVVQFEYNWRWLLNKASLRDVFALIHQKQYRLGKLVGDSIAFYDDWHFELDRYFESNFVLIRLGSNLEKLGNELVFDQRNVAVQMRRDELSPMNSVWTWFRRLVM